MKNILYATLFLFFITACTSTPKQAASKPVNLGLATLLEKYYNERLQLFPLEATANGDLRYNDLLPADFTDGYRSRLKDFFRRYDQAINGFDRSTLNDNDQKSYDILKYETRIATEGLSLGFMGSTALADNIYFPFDQFNGLPLTLGQMGSGSGNQPFTTVQDYDNWLQRLKAFSPWTDSAIVYFNRGVAHGQVLPKAIVIKMIPEMQSFVTDSVENSLFYEPIKMIPASFSDSNKNRLKAAYADVIRQEVIPSYKKLANYLSGTYLAKARTTSGVNALPNGNNYYAFMVRLWTTTNKKPADIYQTGLSEVARIRNEMEQIKQQVHFNGSLDSFFNYLKTDKKFTPYKTPGEVLNAFRSIQQRITPNLKKMFNLEPKTRFEIRQTEAFRAASASAEYYPGLPDGSRPGIFYVPILDATKFNITSGMESLFLHEAIPGHHFQNMLQVENTDLPKFRRFIWYGAYGEGYALYCESLGKELGLYTDPYQHMGALGDEILRAIRLVVDVGLHTGKMTREEAIHYMLQNESISEEAATQEIERYMAYPGQALSYKTGALKIRELREKYQKLLGEKFRLASFHDQLLKDGCMPLELMEKSMDNWANSLR